MVDELQAESDSLAKMLQQHGNVTEHATKKPKLRLDFVANTVEEFVQWMHDRQLETKEAISRGSVHDITKVGNTPGRRSFPIAAMDPTHESIHGNQHGCRGFFRKERAGEIAACLRTVLEWRRFSMR